MSPGVVGDVGDVAYASRSDLVPPGTTSDGAAGDGGGACRRHAQDGCACRGQPASARTDAARGD